MYGNRAKLRILTQDCKAGMRRSGKNANNRVASIIGCRKGDGAPAKRFI